MQFGEIPTAQAQGAILAHSLEVEGRRLKKGRVLSAADVQALARVGLAPVVAARLEPGDVGEDAAAACPGVAPGRGQVTGPTPKIAAVVLAAGRSRRMGPANKLLVPVGGVPMVAKVAAAVVASADEVVVVTGHQRVAVERALAGQPVTFAHNPRYADGLSSSLQCGLAALSETAEAALICLGDMPAVTAGVLGRLIAAFDPRQGCRICVPTCEGVRGNPVLWDRCFFLEMGELAGDVGARHLIGVHADEVCEVEVGDPGVLTDVDTPAALGALPADAPP